MTDLGSLNRHRRGQKRPADRRVADLAAAQHGVADHGQLVALGIGADAIHYRLEAGRLHQLHRGVYAVGHRLVTAHGRWMAAVLACGPGALLSHLSAAALWAIRPSTRAIVDVTAARSRHGHSGIAVHRSRSLHPEDSALCEGIPVTSIARTLLDLAEVVSRQDLARAVEATERLRLFDLGAIERLLARSGGRRGIKPLRAVLREYRAAPFTRSGLELEFLAVCEAHGLPRPETNVLVEGFEVDAVWREQRLVVELDSRAFHDTAAAFERDRLRDAALLLAGYRVLRITWGRLHSEPAVVADTVRRLLAAG